MQLEISPLAYQNEFSLSDSPDSFAPVRSARVALFPRRTSVRDWRRVLSPLYYIPDRSTLLACKYLNQRTIKAGPATVGDAPASA